MPEKYICIHGHFYQPPRENPWLEAIELQDSAYPYHDWNERITAECYGPNGSARILDGDGHIIQITNNYARISYNFGPTLLAWMQWACPREYAAIIAADGESARRFGGHGSAMAQVYNHVIMPLANRRDKLTQIRWAITDFQTRFGRMPEGMWLAEAAVDLETLDLMAAEGLKFTVLSPYQATAIRPLPAPEDTATDAGSAETTGGADETADADAADWQDVTGGRIDPSRAYLQRLPSGRTIALFFYDGPVSQAVAFEGLLNRGENLANRLLGAVSDERDWPQLVHIATDGESYGHHHRHGEMALAYALQYIEQSDEVTLTNYGQFLALHPPTWEVEVTEDTAWSCSHGVGRWERNCGCNSGGNPGWNQEWRAPLRRALDELRDAVAPRYEAAMGRFARDPWAIRDDYVHVVLDRSPDNVAAFLADHLTGTLTEDERITLWRLLELQRHALLMYTSCGWFFDEISGIETVQVIQYAGRVIQLAEQLFGETFEGQFLDILQEAHSNIAEFGDGRAIYERFVRPAVVDIPKVAAHYAISSLFETHTDTAHIYCYRVDAEDYQTHVAGRAKLVTGRARFTSDITGEGQDLEFGVFSFGDHNISGGVRPYTTAGEYTDFTDSLTESFGRADFPEVIRVLDRSFAGHTYSLKSLFRDEQRKILQVVLDATLAENEAVYRTVYESHIPLMRFLNDLSAPLPNAFRTAAEFVLNTDLRRAFAQDTPDLERVHALLENTGAWRVTLDVEGLSFTLKGTVSRLMARFRAAPSDLDTLTALEATVSLSRSLPFRIVFEEVQNIYYEMLHAIYLDYYARARRGDTAASTWMRHFLGLGEALGMQVGESTLERIRTAPSVNTIMQEALTPQQVPRATYRFQFHRGFTFDDARALVPYLADLGISDVYASPILKATPGSMHCYDIVDHGVLNPEIGTEAQFDALASAIKDRQMGLLLDMVPNHMGIGDVSNGWWQDVLENGPSSIYANHFDINWHPVKRELEYKVLLPVLGDQYGVVLASGQLRLAYENGAFCFHYWENHLPVAPHTYAQILGDNLPALIADLGEEDAHVQELESILTALSYLPPSIELESERQAERNREKEVIKRRVAALYDSSPEVRAAVEETLARFNNSEDPHAADLMDTLLNAQPFRPAYWRVAAEEINYRRFFDINGLAAIRVELPEVFHATHHLILRLLAEGKATGLRIDHPDGLREPTRYFRQLQEQYVLARVRATLPETGQPDDLEETVLERFARQWDSGNDTGAYHGPLYVVAEKILSEGEALPQSWAVSGTTGYDFLNAASGVFVQGKNAARFDTLYGSFAGVQPGFGNLTNSTKKVIMLVSLASEINALAFRLERIAERNRMYRDFTLNSLTFALREVTAALSVYRTYTSDTARVSSAQDGQYVEAAVAEAKARNPRTAAAIFDFIRDTVLLRNLHDFHPEDQQEVVEFVMRWQQVTGPVMAKGVEDTAFYIYNRLASLNEVGGHPAHFGTTPEEFHRQNAERAAHWPHSLLASATHDTKRGEDTRARINVLSELPDAWEAALDRWRTLNAAKKTTRNGVAPDAKDEYLLYQTLLGTWPMEPMNAASFADYRERITAYMLKAIKEAKVHTSWVNPNEEYDTATREFVQRLLPDDARDPFLKDFRALQRTVAYFGVFNSLAQQLLKLTSPGVPDIYQGTELWELSLVDPDNRRPVDYARRADVLREVQECFADAGEHTAKRARDLVMSNADGKVKLYLTYRTLAFRNAHEDLFRDGGYLPLETTGAQQEHLLAFARTPVGSDTGAVIVAVPRLTATLMGGKEKLPLGSAAWGDTALTLPPEAAGTRFRNLFTGEILTADVTGASASPFLPASQVFANFPVALLERF